MKTILGAICLSLLSQFLFSQNTLFYFGDTNNEIINDVVELSDKTILIAGRCTNLNWLPNSVLPVQISADSINSVCGDTIGFIMQLSSDLHNVISFIHFPKGTVQDVFRIRTTNLPGNTTGDIYISGNRKVNNIMNDGYYIAKLNSNFITSVPSKMLWCYNVSAKPRQAAGYVGTSEYKLIQPWDVGSDGSVIFGLGSEFDFGWAAIQKLNANGQPTTMNYWRTHWAAQGEFAGTIPDYLARGSYKGKLMYSAIVLKGGRGSLRSWSANEYNKVLTDANGNTKMGYWPEDYYFSGAMTIDSTTGKVITNPGSPGYTGYKLSSKPTARLGAIVIDRRNNHFYFGFNNQTILPDGNPDYEPAVIAMDNEGRLKWWSRLYQETSSNSTPDQYVDGLALDYADANGGALVVNARCHGNNVINFWKGNDIKYAGNDGGAFQNSFTGTNGNIHISWIGRFSLDKEEIRNSTYVAELAEGAVTQGSQIDPLLAGWYNLNMGWPNMNTTKIVPNTIKVDQLGNIYIIASGRRTITTTNAYLQMPKPSENHSAWNKFVRVYKRDLTVPIYSSIIGAWDFTIQAEKGVTNLNNVFPTQSGLLLVGSHQRDSSGIQMMPTAVPVWGNTITKNQDALLALLKFDSSSVNINNSKSDNEVEIYPNPSNGLFTIKGKSDMEFRISNVLGNVVSKGVLKNSESQIDMTEKPTGIYLLVIDKCVFKLIIK